MLLGDYYDEVIKEARAIESQNSVESIKTAEAVALLDSNGQTFENEEQAKKAVAEVIEADYAEKVAAVCEEFTADNVSFENDEAKVAAAMEIVDGWEKIYVEKTAEPTGKLTAEDLILGPAYTGLVKGKKGHKLEATGRMLGRNILEGLPGTALHLVS